MERSLAINAAERTGNIRPEANLWDLTVGRLQESSARVVLPTGRTKPG